MGWVLLALAAAWCGALAYRRKKTPGALPPFDVIEVMCDYLATAMGLWCVCQVYDY
jgi:hypothetical protein